MCISFLFHNSKNLKLIILNISIKATICNGIWLYLKNCIQIHWLEKWLLVYLIIVYIIYGYFFTTQTLINQKEWLVKPNRKSKLLDISHRLIYIIQFNKHLRLTLTSSVKYLVCNTNNFEDLTEHAWSEYNNNSL